MKTHLVFYNWQLNTSFYGIVIDHMMQILEDSSNRLILLTCDKIQRNCFENRLSNPLICKECVVVNKIGLANFRQFGERFQHCTIGSYLNDNNFHADIHLDYNNIQEIKELTYRSVSIGYGALSSYVSYTRNHDPEMSKSFKLYFDDLLISQILTTDAIYRLVDEFSPDEMHVYNGRWADVRPMFDIAQFKGIHINVLEALNDRIRTFYKEIYPHVLPHNIKYRDTWIRRTWSENIESDETKITKASSFFTKRRNAELINAVKVYTSNQQDGLLPEGWDDLKQNIVIFNSSEDEFVALGKDYDSYALFKNQEEGLEFILEKISNANRVQIYIRIHPNLTEVNYGYHKRLHELEKKFRNVNVIPADSPISTYTLIDNAEKVIVFSSTVGVEACFWRKPVILLSGASYYFLDVAYVPKSKDEVIQLLTKKLTPKDQIGALKYAYFLQAREYRTSSVNLNPKELQIFGKTVGSYFPFLRILKSPVLYRIIHQLWIKVGYPLINIFVKPKFIEIPTKDR